VEDEEEEDDIEKLTGSKNRRKNKENSKKIKVLKKNFEDINKIEVSKRYSNSAFITPEAATYLNSLVKKGQ
jgi:7,8-dihydro-6-hydroxymethylpterin-pyrophosphokinase